MAEPVEDLGAGQQFEVTGLEDRWNSHARDNYTRAKTLAEQALAQAR